MIAAHTSPTRAPPGAVRSFLDALTPFATNFNLQSNKEMVDVEYIKAQFHYAEEGTHDSSQVTNRRSEGSVDIKAWLGSGCCGPRSCVRNARLVSLSWPGL